VEEPVKSPVRIGGGSGYWGDDRTAPGRLVRDGEIDYLVMDFLAEVTMSILRKQQQRDPGKGFATDIIPILRDVLPEAVARGVKIICNAGGMNPQGCARAIRELTEELGLAGQVRIAAIGGDDLMPRLGELRAAGVSLDNTETGERYEEFAERLASANAYIGADVIVEALERGANVIVGGRLADPSLTLGALRFEFGWKADDWDLLAAGIVAGHLIECGAFATGGSHQAAWQDVPGMEDIGFPIVEVNEHGRIEISKTPGSGGLVDKETVTEQLLYEIGDPRAYLTPDVSVDFTSLSLAPVAANVVEVTGVRGNPRPATLKVSACYTDGYSTSALLLYSAPAAAERAQKAKDVLEKRITRLGLELDETRWDFIGLGAVHERRTPHTFDGEPSEVVLRWACRSHNRADLQRAAAEISTIFHGPPGKTTLTPGRGRAAEVLSYWPTVVPRGLVTPTIELF
jgi:hypothetical protein